MNEPASAYDFNKAWPAKEANDVGGCLHSLLAEPVSVFHGEYKCGQCIKSSLDLHLENSCYQGNKFEYETDLLDSFCTECRPHLTEQAWRHIECARVKWRSCRTTGTMFVARHFGLPTRGVDWSRNPLVALFFACRRQPQVPGVVWSMDWGSFHQCLADQWPHVYRKEGHVEDDFERDFVNGVERDVFIQLLYPPWMRRPVAQKAFITVAGQFGVDHARKIHELGVTKCWRLVVPAWLKSQVIEKLGIMGVNGYSFEIGDSTVETLATDILRNLSGARGSQSAEPPKS